MTVPWQGWLYVAAALIPFAAFVVQILGARRFGRHNAAIATGAIGVSFALSVVGLVAYAMASGGMAVHDLSAEAEGGAAGPIRWEGSMPWVSIGSGLGGDPLPGEIRVGFAIDHLAALMFVMVTAIATLVHVYATAYMAGDPHAPRFFAYLSLFCAAMLGLIAASNLLLVFVFWELVGLCSYLLIGFWSEDRANVEAANKAFVVNRIGDVGMIVGLGLLWTQLGTLEIAAINEGLAGVEVRLGDPMGRITADDPSGRINLNVDGMSRTIPHWALVIAGLGLFAGCVGKSAQFPLHVWLPDAMAGPTPVSALIHAATMVAAGVYLVGRLYPIFTAEVLLTIAYTGAITLLIAASVAMVQVDYKKVLAYSTVSQLGFMMLALGVGGWAAGLFHLLTHACFKALLFLGAGSVHQEVGTYDLRRLGGLRRRLPTTSTTMLLGTLAIAGVPLFSGFYSKDAIFAAAIGFVARFPEHGLLLLLPALGAALTAFYMLRMWILLFAGEPRSELGRDDEPGHGASNAGPREGGPRIVCPLILLAVPTVALGWPLTILPLTVVGLPFHPVLESWLAAGAPFSAEPMGTAQQWAAATSMLVLFVGAGLALLSYHPSRMIRRIDPERMASRFGGAYEFLAHGWYLDLVYDALVVRPVLAIARAAARFDREAIDGFVHGAARSVLTLSRLDIAFDRMVVDRVVEGAARLTFGLGDVGRRVQSGRLRGYLLGLSVAFVALFVGFYVWVIR